LVATCIDFFFVALAVGPYVNIAFEIFVDWSRANEISDEALRSEAFWAKFVTGLGKRISKLQEKDYFKAFANFGDWLISEIRGRPPVGEVRDEEAHAEVIETKGTSGKIRIAMSLWGFVVLTLTIAGVEKIIGYNSLSPTTDLSQPGQIIPLILGIITFLVGAAQAIKPAFKCSGDAPPETTTQTEFTRQYHSTDFVSFMRDRDNISVVNVAAAKGTEPKGEF